MSPQKQRLISLALTLIATGAIALSDSPELGLITAFLAGMLASAFLRRYGESIGVDLRDKP